MSKIKNHTDKAEKTNEDKDSLQRILLAVQFSGLYFWALAIISNHLFSSPLVLIELLFVAPLLILLIVAFIWSNFQDEAPDSNKNKIPGTILSAIMPVFGVIFVTPFSIGAYFVEKLTNKDEGAMIYCAGSISVLAVLYLALL